MELKQSETIEDLQIKGYKIIQSTDGFKFGIDAVLIANFCRLKRGDVGLDIGTGTGIISILLAAKSELKKVYALEIQSEVADMAMRSVKLNELEERIEVINGDLKDKTRLFGKASMDFVVSNPPYFKADTLKSENIKKLISRHEIKCNLSDIMETASYLLKPNKPFFMIHRPDRLVELIELARKNKLEPKEIRFIHPNVSKAPNLIMIKYVKGGNQGIKILDPLYVYNSEGQYSEEINKIYSCETLGGY
ncbi:MAG: tRNA1(Val) (adenine(37)-N6)-methyltransferase [Proteocatella sp.]